MIPKDKNSCSQSLKISRKDIGLTSDQSQRYPIRFLITYQISEAWEPYKISERI